ncbi:SMI1/KNR4 family protein [Bacillus horti]|uniref:Knr4/Smi1-like domain-containing protein n=1 Tax=Caldalkalibacillus horti TaxID=77523 RepID=A0ABT9VXN8_9BACI|nr:SMI1/KNR4 family protein [Bacillus horti]MDQ0165758.1 hypothetical protein [Bacillus horti]
MSKPETFSIIDITLAGLKKRLDKENSLLIQAETGYSERAIFHFFPQAEEEDLNKFSRELKINLPHDYRKFLLRHNGANLFVHPQYGGGIEIFGLDKIWQYYVEYDYRSLIPKGWFPIGSDNGDMLFVNSNENVDRYSSYLYWTELLFVDDAIKINLNFERWLERLIICNGVHFWEWGYESSEQYYRNIQQYIKNLNTYHGKNYKLDV